jgi:hypothetical protein
MKNRLVKALVGIAAVAGMTLAVSTPAEAATWSHTVFCYSQGKKATIDANRNWGSTPVYVTARNATTGALLGSANSTTSGAFHWRTPWANVKFVLQSTSGWYSRATCLY